MKYDTKINVANVIDQNDGLRKVPKMGGGGGGGEVCIMVYVLQGWK